ncbi:MAG: rod shape-determining protein MreD [Tepidisphaeraceae bacterium]
MRWLPFILLAYVMLGLQIGLGGIGRVSGVNWVLIAAVFIAMNATRSAAVPACFVLGLLHDFTGIGPIGTYALAYSLVAMLIAGTDRALSADHPFSHFVITLLAGLLMAIVLWLHGLLARFGDRPSTYLTTGLVSAFYTAIAALPALWLLNKLRRRFRFRRG